MLDVGSPAPEFELENQDGETVRRSEFEGRRLVLYFYPRAGTRGCTVEADGFRDAHGRFRAADVAVLGVSTDTVPEVAAFHDDRDLPFDLLADPDGEVARAYDSFDTLDLDDGTAEIAVRNTYVVGPDGRIEAAYGGVSPDDHPEELLADLSA